MRLSKRHTVNWTTTFETTTPDTAPMSQAEFKQLCKLLKITDSEMAAKLFGLSWRTCQRYWYGDMAPPGPLARLLRIAVRHDFGHDQFTRKSVRP
jgi:DNA-binding transcriptional regulator YiaG